MNSIVVIDYGLGNLQSIINKYNRLGFKVFSTNRKEDILDAKKIILPGVGHFAIAMQRLRDLNLINILNEKVINEKTPILGICLGMQLFCNFSEEGNVPGLGWINADVLKFKHSNPKFKMLHMGWNSIKIIKKNELFKNFSDEDLFYFVHSYYVQCNDKTNVISTTEYEFEFVSSVQKENIFGVQFHPEKSHEWGEDLLRNFAEL